MILKTSDTKSISVFLNKLYIPPKNSHKGQNGKVLIIGGSAKYHAASIWAAETASHFVDMVHYSSVEENNQIILALKTKFHNGIVVHHQDLLSYVMEDDAILVGPGMERGDKIQSSESHVKNFQDILNLKNEAEFTYYVIEYLIKQFPDKKFVFDAAALQMMNPEWLRQLNKPAIITPHQKEFEKIFGITVSDLGIDEKMSVVKKTAKQYNCVIVLKAIVDIISDGESTSVVEGGNSGLTKGGSGDILAGLIVSLYSKNEALVAAVISSYLLKRTAEGLFSEDGYWYNMNNVIESLPKTIKKIL